MGLSKMHLWFAMSLDAVGGANQHHMLRHILIQDMGTGIDLRQNGNRRASALPASEKRVIAESIGCATRVRFWPTLSLCASDRARLIRVRPRMRNVIQILCRVDSIVADSY